MKEYLFGLLNVFNQINFIDMTITNELKNVINPCLLKMLLLPLCLSVYLFSFKGGEGAILSVDILVRQKFSKTIRYRMD